MPASRPLRWTGRTLCVVALLAAIGTARAWQASGHASRPAPPRARATATAAALQVAGATAAAPGAAPSVGGANAAPPDPAPDVAAPGAVSLHPFPPPASLDAGGWRYFPETGHYLSGGFKRYFDANGGLEVFGYPITEELEEDGQTVQYFQRARLEYHPDQPEAPIQRGLLGQLLLTLQPERKSTAGSADGAGSTGAPPGARFFPETNVWVGPPFLRFFESHGGVDTFGYPLAPASDGVQWLQRARLEATGDVVQAALIGDEYLEAIGLAQIRARAQPPQLARVDLPPDAGSLDVRAAPESDALVTRLPQDAQVRIVGERPGPGGTMWFALRLWNAVDGFVPAQSLAFTPAPLKAPGASSVPWRPPKPPAQGPFPLEARAQVRATIDFATEPDGPAAGRVAVGERARITAWATDAAGRVWYRLERPAGPAWVLAGAVALDLPDPLTAAGPDGPLAGVVAGKGMWFTYDVLRETPAAYLVAAAKANGFRFLAPEVGSSRRGYWAGRELDALLVAAHAAGLKVIPWVYPWLADLPADLDLAVRAARHTAPNGDAVDGLGVDIEENLDEETVRAYGQLLRASLGNAMPLIAITYQPQIASGQRTPFAAITESFNVIAPMSYWHARNTAYSSRDAYSYVAESVRLIRQRTGRPDVPVAVLGQTFDWFTRNEIGPGNPSGEEVQGALQAARDTGALGVGFFNWFSTTPDEWDALRDFSW